jgi:hypothetical protein
MSQFRNIHSGERCFILGCGPSLEHHDLASLKREVTFGMNGIFLAADWLGFDPTYYVVEDTLFHEDRFQDIKDQMRESACFYPLQFGCHGFKRPNHHYYRGIHDFDDTEAEGWPGFSDDATRLLYSAGTATYICMQLALFMGFEEVVLIGMEKAFARARDAFERQGRRIVNASVGGKLEVFERVDYASLFEPELGDTRATLKLEKGDA